MIKIETIYMKKLFIKYRGFISYTFYGTLASLINLLVFHILAENCHIYYLIANVVAYIIAIIFTFITNKYYVFHSSFDSWPKFVHEFVTFINVRLFSFGLDMGLMVLGIHFIPHHPDLVKFIDQVLVGILNYYFSKWFIFRTTDRWLWNKARWSKKSASHNHNKNKHKSGI